MQMAVYVKNGCWGPEIVLTWWRDVTPLSICLTYSCGPHLINKGISSARQAIREGNHYDGLYGEALPERGTFFTLEVYERVEISLVGSKWKGRNICLLDI